MKVIDIIQDILHDRELPYDLRYTKREYYDNSVYRVFFKGDDDNNCIFLFKFTSDNPVVVFTTFSYVNFERNASHNLVISVNSMVPDVYEIDDDLEAKLFQYTVANPITDAQSDSMQRLLSIYKSVESSTLDMIQIIFDTEHLIEFDLE